MTTRIGGFGFDVEGKIVTIIRGTFVLDAPGGALARLFLYIEGSMSENRSIDQGLGIDQDAFDQLLDRIREKEHPEYGALSWDGEKRLVTVTVQFERNGLAEDDETVRARAVRYLEQLTAAERAALDVDITLKAGRPVRAVLRGKTGALSSERLRELGDKAGL